jgi:hypothetical protein
LALNPRRPHFKFKIVIVNIFNSEPFLIVLSGVVIFTAQKIISELWIKPLVKFLETRGKLEVLILRYAYLSQVSLGISKRTDEEIYLFKDTLRELAGELIASYNILPRFEKWWIVNLRNIKVTESSRSIIQLSNLVSTPSDVNRPITLASETIDKIRDLMKLVV